MTDTEIVDWLQEHLTALTDFGPIASRRFVMGYLDGDGVSYSVSGADLRDCVRGAVSGEGESE